MYAVPVVAVGAMFTATAVPVTRPTTTTAAPTPPAYLTHRFMAYTLANGSPPAPGARGRWWRCR
ncbi:hypothetical protein CXF35_05550 [Corynebacterium bovis]|nr:hypothetical protein CXF39_07280 [Corynebacterium bovis]RRQ15387.1 hypothetical protein CXF35_05550 [Corynebacterium bovis]